MARPLYEKKPRKMQMTITVDLETRDRLRCYAYQHRMNLSQAITYLIWDVKDVDMSPLDEIKSVSSTNKSEQTIEEQTKELN